MNWKQVPVYRGITEITPLLSLSPIQKHKAFILGGYARYCCSPRSNPHPAQDVDIFCEDQETYDKVVEEFKDKGFLVKAENDQAVTLRYKHEDGDKLFDRYWALLPTPQIIKPQTEGAIKTEGTKEEILDNFDFTVTRVGLDLTAVTGLADEKFEEDEQKSYLRLRNIHCPVSSTLRAIKYGRKGYWMGVRDAFKLFTDWDNRTNEYRDRLTELIEEEWEDLTQEEIDELEALLRID